MKLSKKICTILTVILAVTLITSLFVLTMNLVAQIILLAQSLGLGCLCGISIGMN